MYMYLLYRHLFLIRVHCRQGRYIFNLEAHEMLNVNAPNLEDVLKAALMKAVADIKAMKAAANSRSDD